MKQKQANEETDNVLMRALRQDRQNEETVKQRNDDSFFFFYYCKKNETFIFNFSLWEASIILSNRYGI